MQLKRLLLAAVALAGLAAAPVRAQEAAPEPASLTVLLEWFVNPDHAPLVIAEELGYFDEQGLDVSLIAPSDPSAPPRLLAAGQADMAIHYQTTLYLDHAAGLPLKRFGTLVETPLNMIMVRADGPIETLADLRGKRIGYSVSGFEEAMVSTMLASQGLEPEDIEFINVNFALSTSLLSGQVDAVAGAYRNFEMTQIRLAGGEGRGFFPEENGVPPYDELIYVTRDDLINDPRLPRFLDAVEKATLYLTNHPQEAWEAYARAYPDLDDELNRQAFTDTLPRLAKRPGALDTRRYQRFGQFLEDAGLIDAAPPVEEVAVELR
jgi:putative hydroxymethylpyrimidine transport system substrate-binding protein